MRSLAQHLKSEFISGTLRGWLMSGRYRPQDRLRETEIATKLGVSRTPVRLAFAELARDGLLEYEPNKGYRVRSFSKDAIDTAYELRETIEGMAAFRAANMGLSQSDLLKLDKCILETDGLLARDEVTEREIELWQEANGVFHETIIAAAQDDLISEIIQRLNNVPLVSARSFPFTDATIVEFKNVIRKSQREHRGILDAIVRRDSPQASKLMASHLREASENLLIQVARASTATEVQTG
ncbi:MAG: GntR family transcriptional regulator [Pseudomonadota bacterium]